MPTRTRVFWTGEEQDSVLAMARQLRQRQPTLTLKQIGTKAQAKLAKHRRRPVNNKLTSLLSSALKRDGVVLSRPAVKRAKTRPSARVVTARPLARSDFVSTLVEYGAAILSGILSHSSVREALNTTARRGRASRKR